MNIINNKYFHMFVRWGLAGHGAIHIIETGFNIYEQAWISAWISAFAGLLMIAGAFVDLSHHKTDNNNTNK
tara:strand:- start:637 stop:849 length:213 start_codon:yes stop_codon:yes gene_type:complete